jgi:hypothetical protein
VQEIVCIGWLHVVTRAILTTSLDLYCAGVRDFQLSHFGSGSWDTIGKSELVLRTKRYLRKRYPTSPVASKFQVTLAVILRLCRKLSGWPCLRLLSDDDLVWAAASVIATSAFLRGGEFCATKKANRSPLTRASISIRSTANAGESDKAVVVSIPQPKSSKHVAYVDVPCFEAPSGEACSPIPLWQELLRRFPIIATEKAVFPAFPIGKTKAFLTKAFMIKRTAELVKAAGMMLVDSVGRPVDVKLASWRSGGVQSAYDVDIPESLIMAWGRWRSAAWRHYLVLSPFNFRGASRKMWAFAQKEMKEGSCVVRVGSRPGAAHVTAELLRLETAELHVRENNLERKRRRVQYVFGSGGGGQDSLHVK